MMTTVFHVKTFFIVWYPQRETKHIKVARASPLTFRYLYYITKNLILVIILESDEKAFIKGIQFGRCVFRCS